MLNSAPRRKTKRQPNQTLARLDHKPHKNLVQNKNFKRKNNDKKNVNDVNVIKERENTRGKTPT
jgi:hypothetical protein